MTGPELDDLLAVVGAAPGDDDAALELSSLAVVTLVDEIERATGVRLTSRDVTRANFRDRRALRALLAAKGAA